MRDGRIPLAWRIDISERCVECWTPAEPDQPSAIWSGNGYFRFEGVDFIVNEIPALAS